MFNFFKKAEPVEKPYIEQLQEAVDNINKVLANRPETYRRIRPYVENPDYDSDYRYQVSLVEWDNYERRFVLRYATSKEKTKP